MLSAIGSKQGVSDRIRAAGNRDASAAGHFMREMTFCALTENIC